MYAVEQLERRSYILITEHFSQESRGRCPLKGQYRVVYYHIIVIDKLQLLRFMYILLIK